MILDPKRARVRVYPHTYAYARVRAPAREGAADRRSRQRVKHSARRWKTGESSMPLKKAEREHLHELKRIQEREKAEGHSHHRTRGGF